ncbi:hypothetical protein DL764_002798 [Monosporascus ibericus]|uniref:BTB domain-containing protein n=1 Tax=Monosporascus ibericus TaxID=155417 RepID=A0A4Q4TJ02_9PEZI|nr:hypothetical protein DL764_002798 [Monosporascus ibericus]
MERRRGAKRSYPEATDEPKRQAPFQSASSIGNELPKLCASAINAADPADIFPVCEYSQRKAISATPTATFDTALSLSHPRYALPECLVNNLKALGIKEIYPWQKQCLMGPGLLTGKKNLVYSAPTGGGKSLVADILLLKRVLEERKAKALLVLPYVALVQEKVRWLRSVVEGIKRQPAEDAPEKPQLWAKRPDEDNIRVVGFFGGGKIRATWSDFEANTLINSAIDDCSIASLRAVVLDELHMVDDDHRGYLMEMIATKLLSLEHNVQIVGMSATLSNIEILSRWLGAHSYVTFYRPVPIEEHLVYENAIYPAATTKSLLRTASQLDPDPTTFLRENAALKVIEPSTHKELQDPVLNAVVALANETARSGYGALVFCGSRQSCESDARLISRVLPAVHELDPDTYEKRLDLVGDLRSLSTGLDPTLGETIPAGVAFHHAGLTTEERDLIASAYDSGVLKVMTATCSLAAGINLPARRVILHNARMGRDLIGPSMLRQMRGRAGRKGKDEIGETFMCCRKGDLEDVVGLMCAELPQLSSGLTTGRHRIQRALLETIAIKLANSRSSVSDYLRKSLLSLSVTPDVISEHIDSSFEGLTSMGFVEADPSLSYTATQLGKAIVASSLEPEHGAFIHREMQRALRAFVLDGEIHVLYCFTPVHDLSVAVNWQVFRNEMEALDDSGLRVMTFLGLKPTLINRMAQGGILKQTTTEEKEASRVYHRFYLALQLRDLCNEIPIHVVARKYNMPRGTVQTLAQTCTGFAAGMVKFCKHMGWGAMAAILDHFSDRLDAGARSDLLALAKITFIKSRTARVFYENGFKSVAAIANADPRELVPVLMQATPGCFLTWQYRLTYPNSIAPNTSSTSATSRISGSAKLNIESTVIDVGIDESHSLLLGLGTSSAGDANGGEGSSTSLPKHAIATTLDDVMRAPAVIAPDVVVLDSTHEERERKTSLNPKEDLWLTSADGRYNSPIILLNVGTSPHSETFYVHRSVLLKAEYFRKALCGEFRESEAQAIDLPEEDPAIFHFVVAFLYEERYVPILPVASVLVEDDKGKGVQEEDESAASESDSSGATLSDSSTARSRRHRDRRRRHEDRHLERMRQKHPGSHRLGCACRQCLLPNGLPCWNCAAPRLPPPPPPPPPGVGVRAMAADRPRPQRHHPGRRAGRRRVPSPPPLPPGVNPVDAEGGGGAGAGDDQRISGQDLRTWLLTYELNIDVYICANKFLLDGFKQAIARTCIDMLETAGADAAQIEVLEPVCWKLYQGLPESDRLLRMIFARVGYLQANLFRRAPRETLEFLHAHPEVSALVLREMGARREEDPGQNQLPAMERPLLPQLPFDRPHHHGRVGAMPRPPRW